MFLLWKVLFCLVIPFSPSPTGHLFLPTQLEMRSDFLFFPVASLPLREGHCFWPQWVFSSSLFYPFQLHSASKNSLLLLTHPLHRIKLSLTYKTFLTPLHIFILSLLPPPLAPKAICCLCCANICSFWNIISYLSLTEAAHLGVGTPRPLSTS